MLTGDDAIARIKLCTATGGQVLGVDGIEIAAEGHVGRLDLILDLSARAITPEAAGQEAIGFVGAHAADNILFDVVTGHPEDVA
ncbi:MULTISPECIES: hypothetical protein [Sphingomonas]|uniref:Phage terminase large subunit-like protein n=1 Tax=Sphingomonas trueperi TaxID=53317 RepID=A0A7X5XVT9_9SPHN|nr:MULTISPECIES: hypothetical protein [Sphingomonas]NJB95848.1 phage terminase large subunit-like protein [Sphingomonas trueperi]